MVLKNGTATWKSMKLDPLPYAVLCLVSQSFLTLWNPMDCSSQAPLSMRILQARILEWVDIPSFRGSSQPRDQTQVFRIAGAFFTIWATSSVQSLSHVQLLATLLPSIFPSIRVFSNESVLRIRWPKYWNFSFSISPSSEYSGLISSRMDWLDLLAVQGTLKSLLQHHSSKASILWCSAFFNSPTVCGYS